MAKVVVDRWPGSTVQSSLLGKIDQMRSWEHSRAPRFSPAGREPEDPARHRDGHAVSGMVEDQRYISTELGRKRFSTRSILPARTNPHRSGVNQTGGSPLRANEELAIARAVLQVVRTS